MAEPRKPPAPVGAPTARDLSDEAFARAIMQGQPLFDAIAKPVDPVGAGGKPVGKR